MYTECFLSEVLSSSQICPVPFLFISDFIIITLFSYVNDILILCKFMQIQSVFIDFGVILGWDVWVRICLVAFEPVVMTQTKCLLALRLKGETLQLDMFASARNPCFTFVSHEACGVHLYFRSSVALIFFNIIRIRG